MTEKDIKEILRKVNQFDITEDTDIVELINSLKKNNIAANIIGEITSKKGVIEKIDGTLEFIDKVDQDELFRVLEETS